MIHLDKDETKAMVAVHGWSGICLGLLLYAVVLTGTAAVFAQEIGAWAAGHLNSQSAFEAPVDARVRRLSEATPAQYRDSLNLFEVGDHGLGAFFHRDALDAKGMPTERGIYYQLDHDGRLTNTVHGTSEEVFGPRNDDALSSFLVDTHVRLHVPNPWGLLLTGVLGLTMLVAAISGLLIHRHLFKDIFTLRRNGSAVLANRDMHSVGGTWSLPFAFVLAFTGSFFSFYGTIGVPVVAMAAFRGDVQALSEAVYGNPRKSDPRPASIGNLDRVTADAVRRTGEAPTFISIEHFGRADAEITSYHQPKSGDLEPVALLYNGATGAFERAKPTVGTRPSAGGTLAGIMGPLHFGNFAGILSKAIWFGLGFAMCYVTYTGMRLWVVRRGQDTRALAWLERTLTVVGFGMPICLLAAAAAFLVTMPLGSAVYWTTGGFLIAAGGVIATGVVTRSNEALTRTLKGAAGLIMIALPLLRLFAAQGPGWSEAIASGRPMTPAIDVGCILMGLWLVRAGWNAPRPAHRDSTAIGKGVRA